MAEDIKTVPARKDFKAEPVFTRASIADQAGGRPGYRRQWFHKSDVNHRNYFEKYTRDQHVGDSDVGYCKADAWTVVPSDMAKPGRKRDDDGKGIETALTHGDLICLETPEENARVWDKYKELKTASKERALRSGEKSTQVADGGGRAAFHARLGQGTVGEDPRNVLNS
jgi:hypothetical protein